MSEIEKQAKEVIQRINENNHKVDEIKKEYPLWFNISNKAYLLGLDQMKKTRKILENKEHVSTTSNNTISNILEINEKLSDYALGIPISATEPELRVIMNLVYDLPSSEQNIIDTIDRFNMHPKWRAMQKLGRIKEFEVFKEFNKIIDAALICYYRENYTSCFLTLAPVIEGVILRWGGFEGIGEKPNFEDFRKFFKNGPMRQPCPYNIQFHEIFSQVCNSILNKTLYKDTRTGEVHADFNRHLAVHLIKQSNFGSKNNCIRLFVLLDLMTEIYCYEKRLDDPRFSLKPKDLEKDIEIYGNLLVDQKLLISVEKLLLN